MDSNRSTLPQLILPSELLMNIVSHIEDARTFYNFSLVCNQTGMLSQSKDVQQQMKNRFARNIFEVLSHDDSISSTVVITRQYSVLPDGSQFGDDTVSHVDALVGMEMTASLLRTLPQHILSKRTWNHGIVVGTEVGYHLNGQLHFIRQWDQNGVLDGEEKVYYENGIMQAQQFYRTGLLEGVQQAWYASGQNCFIRFWRNGVQENYERHWNKQGQLICHQIWKQGKTNSKKNKFLASLRPRKQNCCRIF
jgi:hypothetical protein